MKWVALLILMALPAVAKAQDFQSPSGNVFCQMSTGDFVYVRCDMVELTPSHTRRPADCDLDWGTSFFVEPTGKGGLSCHGDTIIMPDAPVLGYGDSMDAGPFTCTSAKTGVTCMNAEGGGFTLSRARQVVF